jgi:hypothetical protein
MWARQVAYPAQYALIGVRSVRVSLSLSVRHMDKRLPNNLPSIKLPAIATTSITCDLKKYLSYVPLPLNFKISAFCLQIVFMGYIRFSYDSDTSFDVKNSFVCNGNNSCEGGGIGFLIVMYINGT